MSCVILVDRWMDGWMLRAATVLYYNENETEEALRRRLKEE